LFAAQTVENMSVAESVVKKNKITHKSFLK